MTDSNQFICRTEDDGFSTAKPRHLPRLGCVKKNSKIEVSSLISKIRDANESYRLGNPFISDTEYDNMVDELKSKVDLETFESIRTSLMEEPGKVLHPYVMGSLDKIKAFDQSASVSDWIEKHVTNTGESNDGIFISSKIDGCSARLSYKNGILIGASTRGNAEYGEDILSKAVLFVPTTLDGAFSGEIRGEITLTHETFEELSEHTGKEYKNLRNSTVGLVNSKFSSDEEISFLRFFAYEIMGDTGLSKKEQFEKLKKLGFDTALSVELTDIFNSYANNSVKDALDKALLSIYNDFVEKAPFDIDGLVIADLNNSHVFENAKIPEQTVAVKFNQLTATTRLIDVAWNVSKSGRLSPVGIIEMVNLGGSEITNATLNNIRFIKELGMTIGCEVTILKSGDIIPKVVGVSHPHPENEIEIKYPKVCPSCRHELSYDEEPLLFPMCRNPECDGIAHNKILHFLRQLGIKNVSLKTIAKFGLKNVSDLIELKPDGGVVKSKFFNDINNLMFGASKENLLAAFDYDGVSSKIIFKMLSHYGYDKLVNSTYDELSEKFPYGVGAKFMKKFCDGYHKIKTVYERILSDERYHGQSAKSSISSGNVVGGALGGKGFVVTGALSTMTRDNFKMMVVQNGGVYQSSVNKKTSYLVCNDRSSATTKIKKAYDLGVEVIDENKFLAMVRDGTDGFAIF